MREYLLERYYEQREVMFEYLGGKKCNLCGTEQGDFEFDHIDRNQKSFNVSALWGEEKFKEVLKELDKCQVLCSNCHIAKTAIELGGERGWTHGTTYGWMKKKCRCPECLLVMQLRNEKRRITEGARGPYKQRGIEAEHGTSTRYRYGCKCDVCKAAHTQRARDYKAKKLKKENPFCS